MKRTRILALTLLSASLLSAGCSKLAPKPQAEATPDPVPAALPPAPVATPAPVVAVATPEPKPEKRLAPEGVFYLLRGKSVETADGIFGVKPGSKVMKQADGTYLFEGHKLALQPAEVTNDLDIAARVGNAEARAQMAIRQTVQAAAATPVPAPSTPAPTVAASRPAAASTSQPARPAMGGGSSLGGGTGGLGAGHTMTRDGWLWQKDGNRWIRVRPLR